MTRIIRPASLVLLIFSFVSLAQGTTEQTIYVLGNPGSRDGMYPHFSPVFDRAGNMYGTTLDGGTSNDGMILELSPGTSSEWTETVIHEFTGKEDGSSPFAGLVFKEGNLYGTAGFGGANGSGVVFELSPSGSEWIYKVLYSFGAYPSSGDGFAPNSTPVFDKAGNLYGITNEGGVPGCFEGCGTVYELSPAGDGSWKEKVIHTFSSNTRDGELPTGGLLIDSAGNLYGTTQNGGTAGSGVLFKLSYSLAKGEWVETIVHQFVGGKSGGSFPINVVLIMDAASNIYGTTQGGGLNGHGTVFETSFTSTGWKTTVLYSFNKEYTGDGQAPEAGLTMDSKGNLYGTTFSGGTYNYYGTVFKLSKSLSGSWSETILHSFNANDGFYPEATLTLHGGWLFGTTTNGGNNAGVVFQNRP